MLGLLNMQIIFRINLTIMNTWSSSFDEILLLKTPATTNSGYCLEGLPLDPVWAHLAYQLVQRPAVLVAPRNAVHPARLVAVHHDIPLVVAHRMSSAHPFSPSAMQAIVVPSAYMGISLPDGLPCVSPASHPSYCTGCRRGRRNTACDGTEATRPPSCRMPRIASYLPGKSFSPT